MLTRRDNPNIVNVILSDYDADRGNRSDFERNFRIWTRLYEGVVSKKSFPFEDSSNLHIPMVGWTVDAIHSRLQNPLFAIDEILHIKPRPDGWMQSADQSKAVSAFLNWQFDTQLDFFHLLDEATPREILYGSWFVKIRPTRRANRIKRRVMNPDGSSSFEPDWDVIYEGPELVAASPWDIVLPSDSPSLAQADHIIHRVWLSLGELRQRESLGVYFEVSNHWEQIRSSSRYRRELSADEKDTKIDFEASQGRRSWVEALECYYQYDLDDDGIAEEWIFTVLKDSKIIIRATELIDVFPSGKRPFEQFIYKPAIRGPYGKGIGQELDDLNTEVNAIFNQMTDAGTLTLAPAVLSRLNSAASAKLKRHGGIYPGIHIETEDPIGDARLLDFNPNLSFGVTDVQFLLGFAEKITGVSDLQLGRTPDRAGPRTYGQQLMLQEGSNESLETVGHRYKNTISRIAEQVHDLNRAYMPPTVFYRVTGDDGKDVLGMVNAQEMQGQYDFSIKAVSPSRNLMTERQNKLQALQFILPMIDRARVDPGIYRVVKLVWETFGLQKLDEVVGMGEDSVRQEHVNILRGRRVVASPFDDHQRHLGLHHQFAVEAAEEGRKDIASVTQSHIQEHIQVAQASRGVGARKAQGGGKKPAQAAGSSPGQDFSKTNSLSQMGNMLGMGMGQFTQGGGKNGES